MKISKDHLIQQEHATYDQIRDLAGMQLTNDNFGLLPAVPDANKSLDIRVISTQNNTIHVKLMECRAITRGGARIEILAGGAQEDNFLSASFVLDHNDQLLLDIIITVNPFSRMPTGQPDPEETPLRYPFTKAECKLEVIPSDQIKITHLGTYHLTVGKIRVMGNEIKLIEQYIPPCTNIYAFPLLGEFHFRSCEDFNNLYIDAIQIIKKIREKSEHTSLTDNILAICYALASFLSDNLDYLQMVVSSQPPITLIILFKRLSRTLVTALNCMSSADREELLKYFSDWSELNPGTLEISLRSMVDLEYNHQDIAGSAQVSEKFMLTILSLFDKLNQLDYIGKPKDAPKETPKAVSVTKQSLFINEEQESKGSKKRSLWNF